MNYCLKQFSKAEVEFLIKNGHLKTTGGKTEGLMVSGRHKPSKSKERYLPEFYKKYLKDMK